MGAALRIALRELRSRLRDRSALVLGVVAPVGLALILSFAFRGGGGEAFHADLGVVDLDGGEVATIFTRDVLRSEELLEVFTVHDVAGRAAAEAALDEGAVDAVVIVHEGVDDLTVLRVPRAPIAGEIAASVARSFAAQVGGVTQAIALDVMAGLLGPEAFGEDGLRFESIDAASIGGGRDVVPEDVEAFAQEVAGAPLPLELVAASAGEGDLSSASYYGPGMAMLFVFFLLSAGPRSLMEEKESGTLARLRAAPIPVAAILLGKALAAAALGLAAMIVVWIVTALVFGASWGDPVAVVALLVAFAAAALGITTLIASLSRTRGQAEGMVSLVAFVLAMLGGNFVFLGDLPPALQAVARLTPNGWAMQGFTTLAADGGGLGTVLVPLAAILAFAAVTLLLAVPGMRRWTVA